MGIPNRKPRDSSPTMASNWVSPMHWVISSTARWKTVRVTEHGGNIAEDNAFLRKIRNAGDILLNLTHENLNFLLVPAARQRINYAVLSFGKHNSNTLYILSNRVVCDKRLIVRNVDFLT